MDTFLGCATSSFLYRLLDQYWNQVTPGNDGKWASVENTRDSYGWTNLDRIYNLAVVKNIPFKEHTLIWGNQQPWWIATLDSAEQRAEIEEWIQAVGARYPLMAFVDVVNEPFHAPPVYADALGGDGATGWDWVITAFELARQFCPPGAKLHLNEYNILHDDTRTTDYIALITLLKDRGLIDGIGIQGHYFEFRSHTDATSNIYVYNIATIRANLDRLAALDLPIFITEFDIDEADDASQLAQYKIYFPIFWHHPAVRGITFWGYIQNDVWISHPYTYLLRSDGSERPAMRWLRTTIHCPPPPVLISPDAVVNVPRDPLLLWHSSVSATSYRVQIASNSVFATIVADTTTADTSLQVRPLAANARFYWHVAAVNDSGAGDYSSTASFITGSQTTEVGRSEIHPGEYTLYPNFPDPFNPETTLSFSLPRDGEVRLVVFDISGKEVMTVTEGEFSAGKHAIRFDASALPSGLYFCRMVSGPFVSTEKMMLLR